MTKPFRPSGADIPALMRLERGEGFAALVGRWSAEEHAAEMLVPGSRYLALAGEGGALDGFALLQGLDDPHGCATLRRIAVGRPNQGLGAILLDATLASAFGVGAVHRLQLRVYPENARARRAYARAGFSEEGLLRDCSRGPDGRPRSMVMMSMLRPEWEIRQPKRSIR